MPVYEYVCTECGSPLEARQGFHDPALTDCPACGGRLRKVLSPVGVVFKGSGFYRTDSRSSSTGSGSNGTPAKGASTNGSAAKTAESSSDGAKTSSDSGSSSGSSGSGSSAGSGSSSSGSSGSKPSVPAS